MFWRRPETNLRPWNEEFQDIEQGSRAENWLKKWPWAYWKGNPDVASPIRQELLNCNHSRRWGAQIMRQVELELHLLLRMITFSLMLIQKSHVLVAVSLHCRIGSKKLMLDTNNPNYQISASISK